MLFRVLIILVVLQAGPALLAESFTDRVSVMEVQVPVQVTVGQGAVRNLTVENFEVYDRGLKQEIVSFEVIDLGGPSPETDATARELGQPSAVEGRSLVLLFDLAFSGGSALLRSLDGARVMIDEQLHAMDRVAVAYYTGTRGVTFVVGFTSDRQKLATSLDLVQEVLDRDARDVRTLKAKLDRLRGDDETAAMASSFGWPAVLAMGGTALPTRTGRGSRRADAFLSMDSPLVGGVPAFEDRADVPGGILSILPSSPTELSDAAARSVALSHIEDFSDAMSDLATLLRDVEGVRHLLLFSGGFGGLGARSDTTTSKLYEFGKVRRAFLRSGWTLHTVSLTGFNDSLYFLANETGGRTFENYNRFYEATERFLESSSVTYLLTFTPSRVVENGHRHKIKVQLVDGPRGARVTHRPAYYAPKPAKRRNALEQRLDAVDMIFGEEEVDLVAASVLAIPLRGPAPSARAMPSKVPVLVEVGGESLLEGQWKDDLRVEVQGYALDSAGGVADFFVEEIDLRLSTSHPRLREDGVRFFAQLELPPGDYRLRLLVLNVESRRFHLETVPIRVGAPPAGSSLLPPFFLNVESATLAVTESELGEDHLFEFDGEVLLPALEPRIAAGETWPIFVAGYDMDSAEAIEVRVVGEDGREAGGGRVVLDQRLPEGEGGLSRFMGTFESSGLAEARYRLEVRGADGASSSSVFRVVAPASGEG